MDARIQQKILELISGGMTDYRLIQDELRKPSQTINTISIQRPEYQIEVQLAAIVLKYVSFNNILAVPKKDRKSFIAAQLLNQMSVAQNQEAKNEILKDSLIMITLDSQLTTSFDDSDFCQQTKQVNEITYGDSFLESIGLTNNDFPSKTEILELMVT